MHRQVPIRTILIPVDFTDSARQAFYAGISIAAKTGAEVYVLHVSEPIRAFDFGKKRYVETADTIARVEEGVQRRINELWEEGGLEAVDRRKIHLVVRGGKAAAEILAVAKEKEADLIVIGSSGDGGLGSALGSTSEKVTRDAYCSVWSVRARKKRA
ncbi:MAG: universal stress protein [Deltaproteobacteria bacterium]|nr:universal stress protein [Deltaproteobacteria bacterium]